MTLIIRMTPDPKDRIVSLMLDVSRFMRKGLCDVPNTKGGPSMLQLHALVTIREHDGLTMKHFAEAMHTTGPTATTFIQRLVKLGLVNRNRDRTNRKLVHLHLTPAGQEMVEQKTHEQRAFISGVMEQLPPQDQTHFIRILEHLLTIMSRNSAK